MIETRLNDHEFVLTDCTLEQAKHQKPNSNDYGVLELDGAFAIYWKPNYITIRDDHDKQIVTAALQRKNDALK